MFRIYTEDTGVAGRDAVAALLAQFCIGGATIYRGVGLWQGKQEASLVIETTGPEPDSLPPGCSNVRAAVYDYAAAVKRVLSQSAVLVLETADTVTVV